MKHLFCIMLLLISHRCVFSQERAHADLSITSVTLVDASSTETTLSLPKNNPEAIVGRDQNRPKVLGKKEEPSLIRCSITVQNSNDSFALSAILIAIPPPNVHVTLLSQNGTVHKPHPSIPFAGSVEFRLGNLQPGQSITLQFRFLKSDYLPVPQPSKVSGFVYSSSTELDLSNNYKVGSY